MVNYKRELKETDCDFGKGVRLHADFISDIVPVYNSLEIVRRDALDFLREHSKGQYCVFAIDETAEAKLKIVMLDPQDRDIFAAKFSREFMRRPWAAVDNQKIIQDRDRDFFENLHKDLKKVGGRIVVEARTARL